MFLLIVGLYYHAKPKIRLLIRLPSRKELKQGATHKDNTTSGRTSDLKIDRTTQLHCLKKCKYNRKEKNPMIICCMCSTWYHNDCVPESDDELQSSTVWFCPLCRQLPENINIALDNLVKTNAKLVSIINEKSADIAKIKEQFATFKNTKICEHCENNPKVEQLLLQIRKLVDSNATLSAELSAALAECRKLKEAQQDINHPTSAQIIKNVSQRDLLIGDSTIRNVNPEAIPNTEFVSISGGTTQSVYDIVATKSIKYRNITLVVGTNNCSKQDTPETVITNFDKLLAKSKNKATGSITVSGICPRTDNEVYQSKVESVMLLCLNYVLPQKSTSLIMTQHFGSRTTQLMMDI